MEEKKLSIKKKYLIFKMSLSLSLSFSVFFLQKSIFFTVCYCVSMDVFILVIIQSLKKIRNIFWDTLYYISIFPYLCNLTLLEQKTLFTFKVHTLNIIQMKKFILTPIIRMIFSNFAIF